jgi:hypothetical protein
VETYQQKVLGLERQLFIKHCKSSLLQPDVVSGVVSYLDFNSLIKLARTSKSALTALGGQVCTWRVLLASAVEVSWSEPIVEEGWTEDPEFKGLIDK